MQCAGDPTTSYWKAVWKGAYNAGTTTYGRDVGVIWLHKIHTNSSPLFSCFQCKSVTSVENQTHKFRQT